MKWHKKARIKVCIWWINIKSIPSKIKRIIWNKHILNWWHRLYIRKDDLHNSLDIDHEAILEMNEQETREYLNNIVYRRRIAHQLEKTK